MADTDKIGTCHSPPTACRSSRLSVGQREQFDRLCDAFEAQWQQLAWPRIEDYLRGCDEPLRSALLAELLTIDQQWRVRAANGERVCTAYMNRFPGERSTVERVLGQPTENGTAAATWPTSLGPFERLQRIGEGGFGIVFRAWDRRHRRTVALKIPRLVSEFAGGALERFLREAKAAGSLDHPGIARVWDSGTIAGVTYIAYQFVEGENLKARFHDVSGQSFATIATFVRQLAEAVHYAHDRGIVHRDIKPSNVLLTKDNRPVLTDFGLALAIGGDMTRSLAGCVGTLDYMSPEQATGRSDEVDARADIWSLGVLTYELLTGERPFRGATDAQLRASISNSDPKRPRLIKPGIPRDLEVLIVRCLQKRPADRIGSCGILAEELHRVAAGEPIVSRPVSFVERSLRWCRRNPRPLATFGVILLATIFGTWSWGLRLAENQQNQDAVQELHIQLEAKNIERRDLLHEILKNDVTSLSLLDDDLRFIEHHMFTAGQHNERMICAILLLRHNRLRPDRYAVNTMRRARCVEILQELLETNIDEEIQAAASDVLQAAHVEGNRAASGAVR